MNQMLIVKPGDDPVDIKVQLLLKDAEFASRFVHAWLDKHGYQLAPAEHKPSELSGPSPSADPNEPEYVPFIE